MSPLNRSACLACRHTLSGDMVEKLANTLAQLGDTNAELLISRGVDPKQYDALFRAAVERIRGSFAATTEPKYRFIQSVLDQMKNLGQIQDWESIGSAGRLDFRVELASGRQVAIEGKGCPDGNNMNIWDVQPWADEIIVWSQCPDSLAHDPGEGVWSGIATRLIPESVANDKRVDALIFFDGRCGSPTRQCPKSFGIDEGLRSTATDITSQRAEWIPPPCVFLFPRTIAHPQLNPSPPLHDLNSCEFPRALLTAFEVPVDRQRNEVHWVRVAAEPRSNGTYLQISVGWDLDNDQPSVQSTWKRLRRA